MPYAAVSDVKNLAPFVPITAQSHPSEGIVGQWIADAERTINTVLARLGYTIPLMALPGKSTADASAYLKQLIANQVMAMVLRGRPNPEQDPENFQKRADAMLKAITDPQNPYSLPDVEVTTQSTVKRSPMGVSSNLVDLLDESPSRINRDQVF